MAKKSPKPQNFEFAPHHKAKYDYGKKNNGKTTGFNVVAANAAKEYGSKKAGERVAGAIFAKMRANGKA